MDVTVGGSCPSTTHVDCLHAKTQPGEAKDVTAHHATKDAVDLGRIKEATNIYG